jgi:hypothetical protein
MASWQSTWDNAELTIFGFFQTLLGGTYGADAFIGELPKDFEYASVDGVWTVGLEGGGTPLDFDQNMNTPGGWVEKELVVRFEGIWNTRDQAKRVARGLPDAGADNQDGGVMARRITILGMGPTANERRLDIARYCEGTEIWGLNNGFVQFPHLRGKWARYFELHAWNYLKDWSIKGSGVNAYFDILDRLGCPVWVGQPLPMIHNQKQYPFVDVCEHFKSNYFLGSPSLMLMLALYEHDNGEPVEYIQSWGIDTSDPQHGQQRASWAWWLAFAQQRGIDIGGTANAFQAEYERDDGLRGLREQIGDEIAKRRTATAANETSTEDAA